MLSLVKTGVWRCIVFDLDGTVANTIPLIIASYDHALTTIVGIPADPVQARSWIGQTLWDTFTERYPEQVDALVEAYVEFNLAHLDSEIRRYEGMPELLAELTAVGIPIGVATSKRRHSAERTLAAVKLEQLIPLVVAMEDTAVHKPNPEPLRLAVDRLGARTDHAVYIGDAVVDVQAAAAAGMASIAVTWGAGDRDELIAAEPTIVVDTLDQLRSALLG
jgi:pyrophosphatase PpaX